MRFKAQQSQSSMPTVDLIPMLNVMMAVLAFFVLVSMLLTSSPEGVDVQLPDKETPKQPARKSEEPELLRLNLNAEGTVLVDEEELADSTAVKAAVEEYLATEAEGNIVLTADPDVSYEKVLKTLGEFREIDGKRVSLGIVRER